MYRVDINTLSFQDTKGASFKVGDVVKYPNENIKSLICFGFYDNGDDYEDSECGCGFYKKDFHYEDGLWKETTGFTSAMGVREYDWYDKEDDELIINQINMLFPLVRQ